jgi:hypothetical protein
LGDWACGTVGCLGDGDHRLECRRPCSHGPQAETLH